jgi:hypothetical protein
MAAAKRAERLADRAERAADALAVEVARALGSHR